MVVCLPIPAQTRSQGARCRRADRFTRCVRLLLGCALLTVRPTAAQGLFPQWTQHGVPVRPSPLNAVSAQPLPDGHGGTFVAWRDREAGEAGDHMRVQHLRADGSRDPRWPPEGLRVGEGSNLWSSIPDGAGGLYFDVIAQGDYRLVRVLGDGTIPASWAANGGVPLGASDVIATDREGGVWSVHSRLGSSCPPGDHCSYWTDFYVVRVARDGAYVPGWEPPGHLTLTTVGRSGGAWFMGWRATPGGVTFGLGQAGPNDFFITNTAGVCSLSASAGVGFKVIFTGERHATFRYDSDRLGTDFFQYGEFNSSHLQRHVGGTTWPEPWRFPDGVAPAWNPDGVVSDLSGGAFARTVFHSAWLSFLITGRRLNHVLPDGTSNPQWPSAGQSIEGVGVEYQSQMRSSQDGRGGCLIVWQDTRSGTDADIYALRFAQDGSVPPGWPRTGLPLSQVPGSDQTYPEAAADRLGNVFVTWRDTRQGGSNIYAQKLSTDVPVPAQVQRATVRLVDGGVELSWELARWPESPLTVERSLDDEGWSELGAAIAAPARDRWTFVDLAPQMGRSHAYRLAERSTGWTGGDVSIDLRTAATFALDGFAPNPIVANSRLTLQSPREAPIELVVTDLLGRTVARRDLEAVQIGVHSIPWGELARLPAGLYWLRARQGDVARGARFVVTR